MKFIANIFVDTGIYVLRLVYNTNIEGEKTGLLLDEVGQRLCYIGYIIYKRYDNRRI